MTFSGSWGPQTGDEKNLKGGKININTASKEDFMQLDGFEEEQAEEIIRYREEHGRFHAVNDLLHVPKIKPDLLTKDVKDQLAA